MKTYMKNKIGLFAILFVSVFLALLSACGTSTSDKPLKEQFPTLSKMADIEEEEFQYLLNFSFDNYADAEGYDQTGETATVIDIRGVKNLNVGARVNTSNSSYLSNPIFDIGLVRKHGFLDTKVDSTGDDVEKFELTMSSKKDATQESDEFAQSFSASGQYKLVSASVAQNYSKKSQNTTSSGQVGIIMTRYRTGAFINVLVNNFTGTNDFTAFLIGNKLDDATIDKYVSFSRDKIPNKQDEYIKGVNINKGGQLNDIWNVYGNMQLLKKMEDGFSELKATYTKYKDDNSVSKEIKDTMLKNLQSIRFNISLAIRNFYQIHGDAFVSRVDLMNYGYGKGELNFEGQTGIKEEQWGVAASGGYQGITGSVEASASVQNAKQSGWAKEMRTQKVSAASFPSGVVDTVAWGLEIRKMLNEEGRPISVPPLNLPTKAELKLPQPKGLIKDPAEPPDSCFRRYDDWKQYQNDKKPQQPQQQGQAAQNQVNNKGPANAMNPADPPQNEGIVDAELYLKYKEELERFNALRKKKVAESNKSKSFRLKDDPDNILRVEKMFVHKFDITRYDSVIPYLRPNLTIPGESDKSLDGFPNITKLIYIIDVLGDLDNYIRLMSNFSVSGVNSDMSTKFKKFYDGFVKDSYAMINMQLQNGVDIPDALLSSFGVDQFGKNELDTKSQLMQAMGLDSNIVKYIFYLQKPEIMKVWRTGSSGYMPVSWHKSKESLVFLNPLSLGRYNDRMVITTREYFLFDFGEFDYSDYDKNPLDFYDISGSMDPVYKTYKSPLYPVFKYRAGKTPNLIFQQFVGAYSIVIGPHYATVPTIWYIPFNENNRFTPTHISYRLNRTKPKFSNMIAPDFRNTDVQYFGEDGNSFSDSINDNYTLYFNNLPNTMKDKFKALTVEFKRSDEFFVIEIRTKGIKNNYSIVNPFVPLSGYALSWQQNLPRKAFDKDFKVVNLKDIYKNSYFVLQLLPLNKETTNGLNEKAFVYVNKSNATDIVNNDDTFYSGFNYSVFNYPEPKTK